MIPVELDRDAAREAARAELARPDYAADRPGPVEALVRWVLQELDELLARAAAASPGGYVGLVVGALVLAAALVALRMRLGALSRTAREDRLLFVGGERSAAEHRAAAERHAAAEEWAEAVRERLRAIVRGLEERGLLEPRPGRTADEAAREGGAALPEVVADLDVAARAFDEVWYGGRPATAATDERLRAADERIRRARPLPVTTGRAPR